MMGKYISDGKIAVECEDLMKWGMWFETAKRHVADEIVNGVRISTVFLGMDHSFNDGKPILFETMVFGGDLNGEMDRCSTWDEAVAMHETMVKRVSQEKANETI
jgi:hypothetical protein